MAALFFVLTTFLSPPIGQGDWPQFRGPSGDGRATSLDHPVEWGSEQNIAWKVVVPGAGWSSPLIIGQQVYVATAVAPNSTKPKNMSEGTRDLRSMGLGARVDKNPHRFELHALDLATGKTKWKTLVVERAPLIPVHPSNSQATETPATDGKRVWTYFGTIGIVACLDVSGKLLWTKDLGAYPVMAGLGPGSSPLYSNGLLYVACHNETKSFVVALSPETGEQVWRAETSGKTSWATPMLWNNANRAELVVCGGRNVTSFDPKTGKTFWSMNKLDSGFTASPVGDQKRVYFGGGAPGSQSILYAVLANQSGEIPMPGKDGKSTGIAWSGKRSAPGMASPVLDGRELYVLTDFLNCHDAETGERLYKQRLPGAKTFAASPWIAGGKLFLLDEAGQTFVVETGRAFKLVRVNKLPEGDVFWSTPAIGGQSLLIRGVEHLYCIRDRQTPTQ